MRQGGDSKSLDYQINIIHDESRPCGALISSGESRRRHCCQWRASCWRSTTFSSTQQRLLMRSSMAPHRAGPRAPDNEGAPQPTTKPADPARKTFKVHAPYLTLSLCPPSLTNRIGPARCPGACHPGPPLRRPHLL